MKIFVQFLNGHHETVQADNFESTLQLVLDAYNEGLEPEDEYWSRNVDDLMRNGVRMVLVPDDLKVYPG